MTRREFTGSLAAFATSRPEPSGSLTRSFWLFKLLRPTCVMVSPVGTARLHCATASREWTMEGNDLVGITTSSRSIRISGPQGAPVNCMLEVPGVIRRLYCGVFEIRANEQMVLPILRMNYETATRCSVGAELPTSIATLEGLAAQAVASRSVLVATHSPRHAYADFCDTTHCQYLRSPAAEGSRVSRAVEETQGTVLVQNETVMPARYSAACGGQTEAGIDCGYRYVSVACEMCRKLGLKRRGHGWGLCQEGALGLAKSGLTWQAILAEYYPNARLATS